MIWGACLPNNISVSETAEDRVFKSGEVGGPSLSTPLLLNCSIYSLLA